MRHGDKLYDRWVRTHKTRSFVVNFIDTRRRPWRYRRPLPHGGPYQLLALSDDGDVREDARNLGPSVKARVAPATGIVSAHCRREAWTISKAGPAQRELLVEIGRAPLGPF